MVDVLACASIHHRLHAKNRGIYAYLAHSRDIGIFHGTCVLSPRATLCETAGISADRMSRRRAVGNGRTAAHGTVVAHRPLRCPGVSRCRRSSAHRADLRPARGIARRTRAYLSFGNVDVLLGTHPGVAPDAIQEQLVRRSRGGYCFEHSQIFAAALEHLGFSVRRALGRVHEPTNTRTHMTIHVELDGERWLCDPGFGFSITGPIALKDGATRAEGDRQFGVRELTDQAPPSGRSHGRATPNTTSTRARSIQPTSGPGISSPRARRIRRS